MTDKKEMSEVELLEIIKNFRLSKYQYEKRYLPKWAIHIIENCDGITLSQELYDNLILKGMGK